MSLIDTAEDKDRDVALAATTIYVCVTCRRAGDPEDGVRPGLTLALETAYAARHAGLSVRQI